RAATGDPPAREPRRRPQQPHTRASGARSRLQFASTTPISFVVPATDLRGGPTPMLPQKSGERGAGTQALELGLIGKLGAIARCVDHAEKAEGIACTRVELVPRDRRDSDEIEWRNREGVLANQRGAAPTQDQHRVNVLMALERRIAFRRDLEVTQFPGEIFAREQRLARHIPKQRGAVVLVGTPLDALPPIPVGPGLETPQR